MISITAINLRKVNLSDPLDKSDCYVQTVKIKVKNEAGKNKLLLSLVIIKMKNV